MKSVVFDNYNFMVDKNNLQGKENGKDLQGFHGSGDFLNRQLELGRKPAGFYLNRGKAAYWDGYSNTGEQVASGVYFYCLQAGDFTKTRKMVILQ